MKLLRLSLQLTLSVKQTITCIQTHVRIKRKEEKKRERGRGGEKEVDGIDEHAKRQIRTIAFIHIQQLN